MVTATKLGACAKTRACWLALATQHGKRGRLGRTTCAPYAIHQGEQNRAQVLAILAAALRADDAHPPAGQALPPLPDVRDLLEPAPGQSDPEEAPEGPANARRVTVHNLPALNLRFSL